MGDILFTVKGLGREIGVFYHLLWVHEASWVRTTWPPTMDQRSIPTERTCHGGLPGMPTWVPERQGHESWQAHLYWCKHLAGKVSLNPVVGGMYDVAMGLCVPTCGYGPVSMKSLLSLPSQLPTAPSGPSQTYSCLRVLCFPLGAPVPPPALLTRFPTTSSSWPYVRAGCATGSAGLALFQSFPPFSCSVPVCALLFQRLRSVPLWFVVLRASPLFSCGTPLWLDCRRFPGWRFYKDFRVPRLPRTNPPRCICIKCPGGPRRVSWTATSWVFSSMCTGWMPAPVGVGIPQARFKIARAFFFKSSHLFRGEVHSEWKCHFELMQQAQLHTVTKWTDTVGSHQSRLPHLNSLVLCLEPQGGGSNCSGPTPAKHQRAKKVRRWTECVTSLLGWELRARQAFLRGTLNVPDTKRSVTTRNSETHTCTKQNTDMTWQDWTGQDRTRLFSWVELSWVEVKLSLRYVTLRYFTLLYATSRHVTSRHVPSRSVPFRCVSLRTFTCTLYFVLFTFYFLLFTFYFLLFAFLLFTFYFLLFAFCFLLFAFYFLLFTFYFLLFIF